MEIFAIVFGIIVFVGLLGSNIYKLLKMCKSHKKENEVKNFKIDYLTLGAMSAGYGIGGISLILGLGYLKGREFLPGHLALIIIGGFLFFGSVTYFLNNFFLKHYKHDFDQKYLRIAKLSVLFGAFASIIFFITMMEGVAPYLSYPFPNTIIFGGENGMFGYPSSSTGGGFSIAFYAICILIGAVSVYFICDHRFYKIYGKHGMLESTFLLAFPSGIIGARLWFCYVLEFEKYAAWDGSWGPNVHNNPFQIWDGGLAIMGGALLGILVGVLWVVFKKKEIRIRQAIDIIVPTILIAQAIGRWGNFFNQEVYGAAYMSISDGWWIPSFIKYSMISIDIHPIIPIEGLEITTYHIPLFYVEFITNLAGYFFIRYLFEERWLFRGIAYSTKKISQKANKPISEKTYNTIAHAFPLGGCAGVYLIWYGFTRFFLEPLRESSYEYSESWTSSILLIGLGAGLIVLFAIYQYLIEPKHPITFRDKKVVKIAAKPEEIIVSNQNENHEKENEIKPEKPKKGTSLNDEI